MTRGILLLAAIGLTTACGGSVPAVPPGVPVSYGEHLEDLVLARCLGCHTANDPKAGLVLERDVGYRALVDGVSTQVPSMRLVTPGDPDRSYLWKKVDHDVEVGKGMPRTIVGAKRLRPAELELYRRWIQDGAIQ